jgi:hypothetical protein
VDPPEPARFLRAFNDFAEATRLLAHALQAVTRLRDSGEQESTPTRA